MSYSVYFASQMCRLLAASLRIFRNYAHKAFQSNWFSHLSTRRYKSLNCRWLFYPSASCKKSDCECASSFQNSLRCVFRSIIFQLLPVSRTPYFELLWEGIFPVSTPITIPSLSFTWIYLSFNYCVFEAERAQVPSHFKNVKATLCCEWKNQLSSYKMRAVLCCNINVFWNIESSGNNSSFYFFN